MATYFASQLLSDCERQAWVKARALAEALKSECYKYITGAPPYNVAKADATLRQKVAELEQLMGGILAESTSPEERAKDVPSEAWTIEDYVAKRIIGQIEGYYEPKIVEHRNAVARARMLTLAFGAAAVVLSASGGGGSLPLWDGLVVNPTFVAALLGTVTTAAAAVAAWFQSGHHQQLAQNYQAAASKLRPLLIQERSTQLVTDAEAVMQAEHAAWLAEWQVSRPVTKGASAESHAEPTAAVAASEIRN